MELSLGILSLIVLLCSFRELKCSYKSLIDAGIFLALFLFEFNNFQYDLGLVVFNVRNFCSNFFLDCCLAFDIHFLYSRRLDRIKLVLFMQDMFLLNASLFLR